MSAKQLSLLAAEDAATRIGRATFAAILAARKGNPSFKLTEEALIEYLRGPLTTELPHAKRVGRRNPLFDALATACGYNGNMTRAEARTVGVALRDIVEADPTVQPEGITRTAAAVLKKFENAGPMAVAAHWSAFSHLRRPTKAKYDQYNPPPDWHERAEAACKRLGLSEDATAGILVNTRLYDMPQAIKDEVLK